MNAIRLWTFTISAIGCLASASAVTIDLVPIANPGNAPDTEVMTTDGTTGYGSSATCTGSASTRSAGEYTEFLNAVAKADLNELYTPMMDYDADRNTFGANIKRTGISGSYIYSVAPDWANRPVGNVSLWDAWRRFANWLHIEPADGTSGLCNNRGRDVSRCRRSKFVWTKRRREILCSYGRRVVQGGLSRQDGRAGRQLLRLLDAVECCARDRRYGGHQSRQQRK